MRPNERPMTSNGFAVRPNTRVHAAGQQPCALCCAESSTLCDELLPISRVAGWLEMRLSVHLRELTAPVGQARTHPAICNPSQPLPNLTGQPQRLEPAASRQGAPLSPPKQSQLTAAQAKLLFMRRKNRIHSSGSEVLLGTYHREAVRRVEAGTVHFTRTQHGQLRSAMHLVLEAGVRDDRLWRFWTNLFEHCPVDNAPGAVLPKRARSIAGFPSQSSAA